MRLNKTKCHSITFSIYYILKNVKHTKNLGIRFGSKMKFIAHTDDIINKSLIIHGLQRNIRHFKNSQSLITLFNSFVRSKLEYCSVMWIPFN